MVGQISPGPSFSRGELLCMEMSPLIKGNVRRTGGFVKERGGEFAEVRIRLKNPQSFLIFVFL